MALLVRQRLLSLLAEQAYNKVTLLAAAPGYGKSVLLRQWATCERCASIALTAFDNSPDRLLAKVAAAVGIADTSPSSSPVSVIDKLAADAAAREDGSPLIIIIDNYQYLEDQATRDLLHSLILHAPSRVNFTIASNVYQRLDFIDYKLCGELATLNEADLAFSLDEALELVAAGGSGSGGVAGARPSGALSEAALPVWAGADTAALPRSSGGFGETALPGAVAATGDVVVAAGGGFDAETVAKIVEGCEGWPLGLRLALESARDGSLAVSRLRDIDDFFSRFTERAVPDDLLPLLYKTAILEELEAPLCDYVLETNRGKELIEHLERHKVFITSLDKQGLRHRYNRAFADWLQAKLLSLHDINYIHDLHSRAGVWYEEHHSYDIAARHAIAASDLDTIVQIVAPLDSQRQLKDVRQVLEYVSSVPTAEFSKTPLACLLATLAYTHQGRPANALKWVDILRDNYAALARMTPEAHDALKFLLRFVEAYCRSLGNRFDESIVESLYLLRSDHLTVNSALEALIVHVLGESYERCGQVQIAAKYYNESILLGSARNLTQTEMYATYELGWLQFLQGRLTESMRTCLAALEKCPKNLIVYHALCSMVARVLLEQMRLGEAAEYLDKASEGLSRERNVDLLIDISVVKARFLRVQDKLLEASHLVNSALSTTRNHVVPRQADINGLLCLGGVELQRGNIVEALHAVAAIEGGINESDVINQTRLGMLRADILLAQGRHEAAICDYDSLAGQLRGLGLNRLLLGVLLRLAVALRYTAGSRGDSPPRALAIIGSVLDLGMQEGIVAPFLEHGEAVRELLMEMRAGSGSGKTRRAYLQRILRCFSDRGSQPHDDEPGSIGGRAAHDLSDILTTRELEMLRMLSYGMTRQEIAQNTHVSLNTVKTHVASIYAKLDVHSRNELLAVTDAML